MRIALTENDDDDCSSSSDEGDVEDHAKERDNSRNCIGLATSTISFQMLNVYEPSMHRKYPIAVDRLQNEIRDLARKYYSR